MTGTGEREPQSYSCKELTAAHREDPRLQRADSGPVRPSGASPDCTAARGNLRDDTWRCCLLLRADGALHSRGTRTSFHSTAGCSSSTREAASSPPRRTQHARQGELRPRRHVDACRRNRTARSCDTDNGHCLFLLFAIIIFDFIRSFSSYLLLRPNTFLGR